MILEFQNPNDAKNKLFLQVELLTWTAEAQAAAAAGLNYADLQKLEALKTAAGNEGGLSGMGVGMGAGLGLGQMMGMGMGSANEPATSKQPTTLQRIANDPVQLQSFGKYRCKV